MTQIINASDLTLRDVHNLLQMERRINSSLTSFISLPTITEAEQESLKNIQINWEAYSDAGKILEGEIKFLFLSPLMWLAGFYHPSIRIILEERIAEINLEDEGLKIQGRMDILAVERVKAKTNITALWILVIETKKEQINTFFGLPQLLTYASKSLEYQESVWGLTTNGMDYQFIYLQKGTPSIYQLFSKLNLLYTEQSLELLQVLKAIRQPPIS